jgi:hypothetical protein
MPARKLTTDAERHRRNVDRSALPDDCWLWTGRTDKKGYGTFATGSYRDGTRGETRVHKFALEQALGRPLAPGMQALHTCDVRACCRNDDAGFYEVNGVLRLRRGHLWEGTAQDNMADRDAKGRGASEERNGRECYPRGERNGGAKLTETQVREIRHRAAAGASYSNLGAEYGVAKGTVNHVVTRRTWKHVA